MCEVAVTKDHLGLDLLLIENLALGLIPVDADDDDDDGDDDDDDDDDDESSVASVPEDDDRTVDRAPEPARKLIEELN